MQGCLLFICATGKAVQVVLGYLFYMYCQSLIYALVTETLYKCEKHYEKQ